jgi:hypothetical protein
MATDIFGTASDETTLGRSPYLSRFSQFETEDQNYVFIGFTPGLALQAAELNEVQDNFHKTTTLNSILLSNWTLYCIKNSDKLENINSFLWDGVVPISPDMVTVSGQTITCSTGWYYITDPSGIKYWSYLTNSFSADSLLFGTGFANFSVSIQDIFAAIDSTRGDPDLFDNSAGIPNTNSPGAYRVKINLSSLYFATTSIDYPIVQKTASGFFWPNGIQIN